MAKILFTIDTEIGDRKLKYFPEEHAFNTSVLGKIGSEEVGTRFIMDELDQFQFHAEFFLSPYPYHLSKNEPKFKKLSQEIIDRGHGLQIHTHPYTDYGRCFLHELSLDEQTEHIQHGIDKIVEWTNVRPIAHRAGSYAANNSSLIACKNNHLKFDSSYFHRATNCHLSLDTINSIIDHDGVTQVPVTVTQQQQDYFIYNNSYYQKIDIEHIGNAQKIHQQLSLFGENDIVVLFLHSFSFYIQYFNNHLLKYTSPFDVNYKLMDEFKALLYRLYQDETMSFLSFTDLPDGMAINVPVQKHYFPLRLLAKKMYRKIRPLYFY